MYVVVITYIWIGRSWIYLYILRYCSAACIYFSFRWGSFVHSLEIVQWDSTRRDYPGYPGRVSGSGLVNICLIYVWNTIMEILLEHLLCDVWNIYVRKYLSKLS